MMEAGFEDGIICAEFERTEWPAYHQRDRMAFRRRLSGVVCKPLNAALYGNGQSGERSQKSGNTISAGD